MSMLVQKQRDHIQVITSIEVQGKKYIPSDLIKIGGHIYVFLDMQFMGEDIEIEFLAMSGPDRSKRFYTPLSTLKKLGFDHVELISN